MVVFVSGRVCEDEFGGGVSVLDAVSTVTLGEVQYSGVDEEFKCRRKCKAWCLS